LKTENPWNLTLPLHVLVGSDNARKSCKSLHCHISSGRFPDGSFIQMASGLIVCSPELCFLQMAGELHFIDLVEFGYEICGRYRIGKENAPGQGFRDDLPLTSVAKLCSYITKATGLKGRTNALKALRFIADGSASPMETVLTMLLTLPYRIGGYGFPLPMLNHRIEVTTNARKSKKYYCDLYWPSGQVDVEYDSDAFHTGPDRIAKDAIRRTALMSAGIAVVTISRKQLYDVRELREVAELLSQLLGKRLRYPKKEFAVRHAQLRRQLLLKMPADK